MNESEPTIRLTHSGEVIRHGKRLIRRYIECDAYVDYDWLGSPGGKDVIAFWQRTAINGVMHARAPEAFWSYWHDRRDRPPPELQDIPRGLDLIDGTDSEVERGITAVFELVSQMARIHRVRDVAPTKVLHLLRPRFVAISDNLVRPLLGIPNTDFLGPSTGVAKGKWYAARALKVQRAIRTLAQDNAAPLNELHVYANDFAGMTGPGLLEMRGKTASMPPVQLSKARVLDIVLWARAAWGDAD